MIGAWIGTPEFQGLTLVNGRGRRRDEDIRKPAENIRVPLYGKSLN